MFEPTKTSPDHEPNYTNRNFAVIDEIERRENEINRKRNSPSECDTPVEAPILIHRNRRKANADESSGPQEPQVIK